MNNLKILLFAANPLGDLKLDEEIRAIEEMIQGSKYRDQVALIPALATRPGDLITRLGRHTPVVVHFSGHGVRSAPSAPGDRHMVPTGLGDGEGEILLVDDNGAPRPMGPEAMGDLFLYRRGPTRLVVLNACFTRSQAQAIGRHVDCVIGTNRAIGDRAARVFASRLYQSLVDGNSVQQAFHDARVELKLQGIPESATLELVSREGVDPSHVFLIEPTPPRPGPTEARPARVDGPPSAVGGGVRTTRSNRLARFLAAAMVLVGGAAAAILLFQPREMKEGSKPPSEKTPEPRPPISSNGGGVPPATAKPKQPDAPAKNIQGQASFTVPEVARLYNFPVEFQGKGQTIGLIELRGGYRDSDLDAYFAKMGLPTPNVTMIWDAGKLPLPDGVKPVEEEDFTSDLHVTLDIEVAGSIAPLAEIVVYRTPLGPARGSDPFPEEFFLEAVDAAINDEREISILAIGWGWPEIEWTPAGYKKLNTSLKLAALKNITVLSTPGDFSDRRTIANFPGSSPYLLSVGAARMIVSEGKVISEIVPPSGVFLPSGVVSRIFPRPEWQTPKGTLAAGYRPTNRCTPDVVAIADPKSGYQVFFEGRWMVAGETYGAVPLWAGLIALINEGIGKNVGFFNRRLYEEIGPSGVLRSISTGKDQAHVLEGSPGWNAYAGWGSPDGRKLLDKLKSR